MMKKTSVKLLILAVVACLICLPMLSACNSGSSIGSTKGDVLKIYNWEDYIEPALLDEFKDYYKEVTGRQLSIIYTTFDTNETMMTKVLKNDANVDLICPSEYAIEKLMLEGLLVNQKDLYNQLKPQLDELQIDFTNISTLGEDGTIEPGVMDMIRSMFSDLEDKKGNKYDMTEYMVPYMWGTLGILYNTSVISIEELEEYGWGVLWNEQGTEELENKILMKDSVRDSYAAAVLYMKEYDKLPSGYEELSVQELINCVDAPLLDAAEKVLTEQRDHISGYEVDFGKDDMINEIVYADFAWSGDALWAIEEGDYDEETDTYQLGYYVPTIGSNVWYDGWVIPKTVGNPLAAMMFLDYMCTPMSGISNSMAIGYTSAVAKELVQADEDACAYIEECEYDLESYFEDTGRYPNFANEDDEFYGKLGVMRNYGDMNETVVQMWQRAKSGGSVSPVLWYCLLAIVLFVGVLIGGYYLVQAFKRRPRKIAKSQD